MSPPARLLGPAEVRRLAAALGLRPAKSRGQNFLVDANTVRRLVRAAGVRGDDVVLEVGPGLGSLTLGLVEAAAGVVAVEVDAALAAALPGTVAARAPAYAGRLRVLPADGLRLDAAALEGLSVAAPTVLAANLPYNVAVPLLLRVLERVPSVSRGLVMVQAEVAERLCAAPGAPAYGVPSVKLAWWAAARWAGPVSRAVFWPVPRVDSGLVALRRREPPSTRASRAEVFALVDAAFAQRRKTLRAALAGWAGSAAAAETALRDVGIDPAARGETLDVADFARLAAARPAATEPTADRPGADRPGAREVP